MDHNKMHNMFEDAKDATKDAVDKVKKSVKKETAPESDSNEAMLEEMKKNDEKSAPTVTGGGDYPWVYQGTSTIENDKDNEESK